jgi:hypothetical protein
VCLHTQCLPYCDCDQGYYAPEGELRCLPEGDPDPCEEQDCSGHGRCELDENNQPYCICDEGYGPGPDNLTCTEECAWTFFSVESVPPNLLLVVDKSGSMNNPATEGGSRTKLQDAQDALSMMLDEGQGAIRFGWMEFPTDDTCAPGAVQVECSDLSIPDIRDKILALLALGGTPTGPSLDAANEYQGLHDTTRANFVVLLTDGTDRPGKRDQS